MGLWPSKKQWNSWTLPSKLATISALIGLISENLEIDWKTGKVQSTNNNVFLVILPNMILNGKSFIGGNITQVERRI